MILFAKVFTVLSLYTWVTAGSEDCIDELTYLKPDEINLIFGNWTVVIAAADEPLHENLRNRSSSWFELKPAPTSRVVTFHWGERSTGGVCIYGSENSTVRGETERLTVESEVYSGQYLTTCQGCYQGITKTQMNGVSVRYFIMAKDGGGLTQQERQAFEKQAECLRFPPVYFTFPSSEPCPQLV